MRGWEGVRGVAGEWGLRGGLVGGGGEKDDRVVCGIHQTADYEIGWRSSFSLRSPTVSS